MTFLGDIQQEQKCQKRKAKIVDELKSIKGIEERPRDIELVSHVCNLVETHVKSTDCIDKQGLLGDVLFEVYGKVFTQAERDLCYKSARYLHAHGLIKRYGLFDKLLVFVNKHFGSKKSKS